MTNAAYSYNLENFETRETVRRPVISEVENHSYRAAENRKFVARLFTLLVAVAFLLVYTVRSNMMLTKTKAQITNRNTVLTEVQSENVYLDYQIESMVSIENIEDYAVNVLHLVKMSGAQIDYVNLESQNSIVEYNSGTSFGATVSSILDSIAARIVP